MELTERAKQLQEDVRAAASAPHPALRLTNAKNLDGTNFGRPVAVGGTTDTVI